MNPRKLPAVVGDQNSDGTWLSVEQVAYRLGLSITRVRTVLRRLDLPVRGSKRDPFVMESAMPLIRREALEDQAAAVAPTKAEILPGARAVASDFAVDRLIVDDALDVLRSMPAETVQAAVTSPPFWGQRVYEDETPVVWADGSTIAFGREKSPEDYAEHSAEVIAELMRVLKPDGTIWWNIGDSYQTRTILHGSSTDRIRRYGGERSSWQAAPDRRSSYGHGYLKDKDLTLVPFLVGQAAQRRGLWLRSVIIWSKQQPEMDGDDGEPIAEKRAHMPEPVLDRPVTGHEYILLFAKSPAYAYHSEALAGEVNGDGTSLNVRTVWTFKPVNGRSERSARFPDELPRRCIALATTKGELVLDPFAGHGTTLAVAATMGRHYLGIEISGTYAKVAQSRLKNLNLGPESPLVLVGELGEDPGLGSPP